MDILTLKQLDQLLVNARVLDTKGLEKKSWLSLVRKALGVSQEQIGFKLGITKQSVAELEKREREGSITLRTLENAADALDMKLVYTLVPKDGSLQQLVERKARELAVQIVSRTYNTMALENQAVSVSKFNALVEERIVQIKADLPKALWN
jgi:predicted DNA-binding mobile mystery protein A